MNGETQMFSGSPTVPKQIGFIESYLLLYIMQTQYMALTFTDIYEICKSENMT